MHCRLCIISPWPLALALGACAGASPALEPAALGPQIAQSCKLPAGEPADPDAPLRVFVEIATVTAPHSGGAAPEQWHAGSFAEYLNDGHLTIHSVAGVLATHDVPVTIPSDPAESDGMGAKSERWERSLKAHLEPAQPNAVTLELAWTVPGHRTVRTTLRVGDQQPTVLQPLAQHTGGEPVALVLTPTIIRNDGDLRALYACKRKHARAARRYTR